MTASPPWPAWVAAAACGAIAVATALPWFPGGGDAFQIPLASLWSDVATGVPALAIPLLAVSGVGLLVALLSPVRGRLGITFLAAGGVATALVVWYVLRILGSLSSLGGSVLDVVSFGVWIAAVGALATLVAGLMLSLGGRSSGS